MNLIPKSLTRIECSPFFNPKIPTGKRITSHQIRLHTTAAVTGSGGGRKQRPSKSPSKTLQAVTPLKTTTEENELTRPSEIAYETGMANWVNLIGFVDQPVQFEASEDGKFWAGTVISQRSSGLDSSSFWIPIIFEGDLAKVAARYVKKDDQIHVYGKLFTDSPPPNVSYAQSNVQVLVQKLNFVQPASPSMVISSSEKEESGIKKRPGRVKKDIVADEALDSWNHLTGNPKQCQPDSLSKEISSSEREESGIKKRPGRVKKDIVADEALDSWNHLTGNPKQCQPDSLSKEILSSEREESGIKKRPGRVKKDIVADEAFDSWNHLTGNPKQCQPDSLSKEISSSEREESGIKKQPARPKDAVTDGTTESWNHLIENSKQWWDHRENKVNGLVKPRHPDFKNKDSSLSLWLNKAPAWVLPKLEGLDFDVFVPKARGVRQLRGEESWKDLVQNPDKWWDNRTDKRNAKAPDFKHKETGEALWLNESPTWVLPELAPARKKRESAMTVV